MILEYSLQFFSLQADRWLCLGLLKIYILPALWNKNTFMHLNKELSYSFL